MSSDLDDTKEVTDPFGGSDDRMPLCRRKYARTDVEGRMTVIRVDEHDQVDEEIALYLRDTSKSGFSGTYFGEDRPAIGPGYLVKTPVVRERLRLVWAEETISGVYMLGFEKIVAS
jgi:hypothetical protein